MLIPASNLKLAPDDFTIDPVLAGVIHIHKRIGNRVYEAYVPADAVNTDHNPPYLYCFPDSAPAFDATPIPLPVGWQPRNYREIYYDQLFTWRMSVADFATLEWVPDRLTPQFRPAADAYQHYPQLNLTPHHTIDAVIAAIAGVPDADRHHIQAFIRVAPDLIAATQQALLAPSPEQQAAIAEVMRLATEAAKSQMPSEQLNALQQPGQQP